jgi:acyl carrier protein
MEEDVARVWMDVLNLERVGVDENFFELGGHSLLATQVIARIQSLFHVELPLRTLFDFPTVALLAQHLQSLESDMEDILLEAESLSDEEIDALLSSEMKTNDKQSRQHS